MATQPPEAVGSEPVLSPEDRLNAAFDDPANRLPDEIPLTDEETQQVGEDDIPLEEEVDDLPPIDAPVSWDTEAKERFSQLPREDQEYLAKRESERERFLTQKSQEAARTKTEVEQAAIRQLSEIERGYAQHFEQLANQIEPQRPNPALLQYDQSAFYAQQAAFENAQVQKQQLQQRAQDHARLAQEREAQAEQAFHAEQHRIIVENFPEYTDPTTGPKLQQELSGVARELGYPPELIAQARASDIIAMKKAADWKAKADKYDALQKTKMEKVRSAKDKPPVSARPGVAQPAGAARQQQYAADREAMRNDDKAATQRVIDSFFQSK